MSISSEVVLQHDKLQPLSIMFQPFTEHVPFKQNTSSVSIFCTTILATKISPQIVVKQIARIHVHIRGTIFAASGERL